MENFELAIPFPGTAPRNLDYNYDPRSRQLALTVLFPNPSDWRSPNEVDFIFEGVIGVIGSLGLIDLSGVESKGIYRSKNYQGAGLKFAFRYSDEDVIYILAESVSQVKSSPSFL